MQYFIKLINICSTHRVVLQTHNFPDPDAIASVYGLQVLLKTYGIETVLCYDGKIDKVSAHRMLSEFNIIMHSYAELKPTLKDSDYIVCVDAQKHGGNMTDIVGEEIACIDHHPTYVAIPYEYCDIRNVGACATIIASYFKESGVVPDCNVASALVYGIKMDTLQFTRGVTQLDVDMYSYLFPYSDFEKIAFMERNNLQLPDLQAYSEAIRHITVYESVGFSCLNFACSDAMLASVADFILSLVEVHVAIVYSVRDNGLKFSVRSEDENVDSGELIRVALKDCGSGGGHSFMAGGFISKEVINMWQEDYFEKVQYIFKEALKIIK